MNDQFCLKASQIPMRSSVVQEFLRIVAQMWWNRFWDSFLDFHFPRDETSIKFEFSEKATKFDKIFFVLMTRARNSLLMEKSTKIFFKCGHVVLYKLYFKNNHRNGYWQGRLKKLFYPILCRFFFFSRSFINGHFKDKKDTFTMQSETCQSPCNYLKS